TCLNALPKRRRIYVRSDKYSKKLRAKYQTCLNALPKRRRIYVRSDKYSKKLRAEAKFHFDYAEAQAYICAKHKYNKLLEKHICAE
ncbi:MAG: hypothetical protein K2G18_05825, partial [Bacteroidales bacterium]|nr:hypothetical protein [Bacteroidales bacterium]